MSKENYIKSLEGFMMKVAEKVKCLPDFTDLANENDHILRAIEQLQNTSSNSDYAKCRIEDEIKRLEENPEGDYVTRISTLEWALHIIEGRF